LACAAIKVNYQTINQAFMYQRAALGAGVFDEIPNHLTTAKCHRFDGRIEGVDGHHRNDKQSADLSFRLCTKCSDNRPQRRNRNSNVAISILPLLVTDLQHE